MVKWATLNLFLITSTYFYFVDNCDWQTSEEVSYKSMGSLIRYVQHSNNKLSQLKRLKKEGEDLKESKIWQAENYKVKKTQKRKTNKTSQKIFPLTRVVKFIFIWKRYFLFIFTLTAKGFLPIRFTFRLK